MDISSPVIISILVALGLLTVASIVWALTLERRLHRQGKIALNSASEEMHVEGTKVFAEMDMSKVEAYAQQQMKEGAEKAAARLQQSLTGTVEQIAKQLTDMTSTSLSQEFEKYRVGLEALRTQSISEFDKLEKELNAHRTERLEQLDKELRAEYEKRIDAFNLRINDVVSSYVIESLGDQVDLGSQSAYMLAMLEQHKEDIKRDVLA